MMKFIGTCYKTSNRTFFCECTSGWQGKHCETKVNYCENTMCLNNGVCQPLLLNYSCQCLGNSYSGGNCETTSNQMTLFKIISKSFAFAAIIAILTLAIFIITLDILKYCFGIDPIDRKLQLTKCNIQKKKKKPMKIIRFIYINAPPKDSLEQTISTIEETII